jgi:hypothetical protein
MIHVPFDLSKFGFIFMSLVAPCHYLPSYDLARKKAYILVLYSVTYTMLPD